MPVVIMSLIGLPLDLSAPETWAAGVFLGLALLIPLLPLLAKHLGKLVRLAAKTLAALGSLAIFKLVGGFVGLSLGVNFLNALTIALLGLPGFGLLMMLDWACKL